MLAITVSSKSPKAMAIPRPTLGPGVPATIAAERSCAENDLLPGEDRRQRPPQPNTEVAIYPRTIGPMSCAVSPKT
jgi:hypothetical protein